MTIKLPEMLSLDTLGEAMAAESGAQADISSAHFDKELLHLDLSRVEYADFGALAQVLLLAEAAARSSLPVQIDLPTPWIFEREEINPSTAEAAARRALCLQFLRAAGFVSAGLLPHLPHAAVEMQVPPDSEHRLDLGVTAKPVGDVARILTFRWLAPHAGEHLWKSDDLVAIIRSLRAIGLSNRDAQLLANAVLFELIENVGAHAADSCPERPHALVGAIAVEPDRSPPLESIPAELLTFSEWSTNSTMVRLVVGDSGIGLVNHLSPHAPASIPSPDVGEVNHSWDEAEQIAMWALERWSTSSAEPGTRLGTRGLWRVQRAVRSYGGAVTLHTADAAVGYAFMPDRTEIVRIARHPHAPGTLLDVRVLPTASSALAEVKSVAAKTNIAERYSLDLNWLRLDEEANDTNVFAEAGRLVRAHSNVLFTVDGGPTHRLSHERLVSILASAAELATPAVIAVLLTGIDPVAIDAGLDALHNPPPESTTDLGDPFLLVDGAGVARWCGGSADVRRLMQELMTGPASLTAEHDTAIELRSLLADQPHLVQRVADSVELLVDASHVVEALSRFAEQAIQAALDSDGPGVQRGNFRTPNLHVTDRWVDVDQIIDGTIGTGIAAFLLAQKLAHHAPEAIRSDTLVVQTTAVVHDLAKMLAECARLRLPVYQMVDDAALPTALDPLPPNTRVLLCGDVLLTENSTWHKAKEILGWHAVPAAVVVALDARSHGGPIEVGGVRVPVVALTSVSSVAPKATDGPIIDMDPVMRVATARREPESRRYRWDHDEFLLRCSELPWIVGLGHVVRPAGRHFTAYLDASRLIDPGSRLRDEMAAGMVESIVDWLNDDASTTEVGEDRLAVCHAGSPDGYARRLASLLGRRVARELGMTYPLVPIQVSRAIAGSRYAFPDVMGLPADSDVVLVDWGSFDATTILQLIRLAAEGGARRIYAIVILSQLNEHDERTLTMLRSVSGSSNGGNPVPTTIKFWTTLGITPLARSDCTLCRLAETMKAKAQYGMLPHEVARHAVGLANSLRPLSRDLIAERTVDAFGARATTQDAIEYVRLRKRLLVALRSTATAEIVAREIAEVSGAPHERRAQALIRLLAAEQQWLGLRPIRLRQCLADVVRLATALATEPRLDERLRLQAIIVLANASPAALVRSLNLLWRSALQSDELLLHLLYELWMIGPGSNDTAVSLVELRDRLAKCLRFGPDDYLSPDRAEDMQYLLTRLLRALDWPETEHSTLTPLEAWARLREYYLYLLDRHSDAETAVINLLVFLEDLPTEPEPLDYDVWQTMSSSWSTVVTFLRSQVLPYTPPLAEILTGAFAQERFSMAQRVHLQRLTSPHAANDITVLESQIRQLRRGTAEDAGFAETWQDIARKLDDWYCTVLAAGGDDLHRADLAAFLDPCPASLIAILHESVDLARRLDLPVQIALAGDLSESEVFLHKDLLRNTIQQLINNTVKPSHRHPEHRNLVVNLEIEVEKSDRAVRLRFRNTGTTPTTTAPGKGIVSTNRKLKDFDASLAPIEPSDGWTYEIALLLTLWSPIEGEDPLP